jgi:uncharacterized protein
MVPHLPKLKSPALRSLAILVGGLILLDGVSFLLAEGLWFQEVNYLPVLTKRLVTQAGLGLAVFALSLGFLGVNLRRVDRQIWGKPSENDRPDGSETALGQMGWGQMGLLRLLPLTLLITLALGALLLHYGQIAVHPWQPQGVPSPVALPPPTPLHPVALWQKVLQMGQIGQVQRGQAVGVVGLAIALLIYPKLGLGAIALFMSLSFSLIAAEQWAIVLLAQAPTRFHQTEPLFEQDIGFYVFTLPIWELLEFWLLGLVGLTLLSASLAYLLSGNSLSQGYFPGFSPAQQRHLYGLGGLLLLAVALGYWLDRYTLLYSAKGATYGAGYTSINTELPLYTLLSIGSLLLGIVLLGRSLLSQRGHRKKSSPKSASSSRLLPLTIALFLPGAAIATYIAPLVVQRLVVQPNELNLEQPFIQRTIALTREAFNLNQVEVQTFNPDNSLTDADIQRNNLTVNNIRIWDNRPLLQTNRQLQRIRSYYEFPNADIDRYSITAKTGGIAQQQVLIAARELDYSAVPTAAQTWVNQHLIYTHGYGFTLSPVNVVGEGGLPDYLIQGIEPVVIDDRVKNHIPIGKPRIYYGELTNTYVMTQTQVKELDYPSGSDNVYNVYDGRGGVSIGNFWRRLLFAKHLRDWRLVLADNFVPQTKLLFRRQIDQRVRAIAPFLRFDSDPYLVVADTGGKAWERDGKNDPADQSYLYWMIDAYTVSDRYPYSDPTTNRFNYIRNSVKVVVDAYHGSVNFYVADPQDPVIRAWQHIFPGMFQPIEQMPPALRQHIRYAQDLYRIQTEQLMSYHMTDPVVFYNREDQWRAPNEIYGGQQQLVEPYYLITQLPTGSEEEFILLRPFTPTQRTNLIAWMAARSDGSQYGKMLLYVFPKQKLVFGPEQIEARINQDPVISERISLWNRQGSKAVQGNLLVIPIEQSLLYVEPLYLEAEQNQLPTLVRVIVAYGNRIAMAESLERSLQAIFLPSTNPDVPIVRPVN